MTNIRLIARLDIKGPNIIKGTHLEGLRVIGDPNFYAKKYYQDGIDEFLYMDTVASLYQRNSLTEIIQKAVKDVFVPITVGGGIRSVENAQEILRSGADKIAINTEATKRPELVTEISRQFGAQCVVLSIEAKKQPGGYWEVYTDNGRERTGLDVIEWAKRGEELGAGEILLTSIDQEGTRKGFDIPLVEQVTNTVSVPVIASGGMGNVDDLVAAVKEGGASAIAMADILHFNRMRIDEIRTDVSNNGINLREL